ncbi:ABC transporter substrate-binding protein [Pseudoroseomonas deserti]|uniref:ABC transporter substrate-binding protein n=1 Tax=Teichococcus deserti TaxID=1817963 RepID=A0A1V2GWQ9_9PROT|nr:ABC transporter substrate-binding protein [Pseudoroseomonas deserti]ONG48210.1 ABC transporter substrate-binding protein [Pseudoroseomonas deserti]
MTFSRRSLLLAPAALLPLSRPALSQSAADSRPTITVAVQKLANSNTLEPLRESSNVGTRLMASYAETLMAQDWLGDLTLQPGLATAWRRIDDRVLEVTLRPGVRFHDGREMTAEDVAFSFGAERMGSGVAASGGNLFGSVPGRTAGKAPPPETAAIARRSFPGLVAVEIRDAQTVRLVHDRPTPAIEGRFAQLAAMIVSRAAFEAAPTWLDWARRPVGTGPYAIAEFRPDQLLRLVAHDAYWGGRPPLKEIRFVEVPEVSSRLNMLASGEADFACDVPPDLIEEVERRPRQHVVGGLIMNMRLSVFDKTNPVLADARIRRALTHSIDRQSIVDALWGGRTSIPRGEQFEFYGEMYQSDWNVPAFNPDEAKRLLKESGYKGDPIPYRLLNNYYTGQVTTAQILVEGWRAVGLNVQIETRENFSQVLSKEGARGIWDWSNSAAFNDPTASMPRAHGPEGQQWQVGAWRNEEFGKLCAVLDGSVDQAERRRAFRRMLEIAEREDPAYSVLHQTVNFTAKRRDLPWKPGQSFGMDFRASNWKA